MRLSWFSLRSVQSGSAREDDPAVSRVIGEHLSEAGFSGFATAAKAQAPSVPVILITGYYGFVAPADPLPGSVLYKPVDLDALTREITACLGA